MALLQEFVAEWVVEAPWGNRKRGRESGGEAWLGTVACLLDSLCFRECRAGKGGYRLPTLDSPRYSSSQSSLSPGREEDRPSTAMAPLNTHTCFQSRVLLGTETAAHKDGQEAETEDAVHLLDFRADLKYLPPLTWC